MPITRTVSGQITGKFSMIPNPRRKEIVSHAINVCGYLIPRGHTVTMEEFADLIEKHYDCTTPQNAAMVQAVRHCIEPVEA